MTGLFQLIRKNVGIAIDLIRLHGWRKFTFEIVPWLFRKQFLFYSCSLEELPPETQTEIPFRLELAEAKDLHHLVKLRVSFYSLPQVQERLRRGHFCFLGWSEDKPIHIRWVYVQSSFVPYLRRTIDLPPGTVYSDEAYTSPEYRCKDIYSRSEDLMQKYLKDLGLKRIVRAVPTWDTHVQNVADLKGLKIIGVGGYWNLPLFRKFFWSERIQDRDKKTIHIDFP